MTFMATGNGLVPAWDLEQQHDELEKKRKKNSVKKRLKICTVQSDLVQKYNSYQTAEMQPGKTVFYKNGQLKNKFNT